MESAKTNIVFGIRLRSRSESNRWGGVEKAGGVIQHKIPNGSGGSVEIPGGFFNSFFPGGVIQKG